MYSISTNRNKQKKRRKLINTHTLVYHRLKKIEEEDRYTFIYIMNRKRKFETYVLTVSYQTIVLIV